METALYCVVLLQMSSRVLLQTWALEGFYPEGGH